MPSHQEDEIPTGGPAWHSGIQYDVSPAGRILQQLTLQTASPQAKTEQSTCNLQAEWNNAELLGLRVQRPKCSLIIAGLMPGSSRGP